MVVLNCSALFLAVQFIKQVIQPVEFFGPKQPVFFNPARNLIQLFEAGLTISFPPPFFDDNQPALRQDFDVLRYSRPTYVKVVGYGI